MKINYDSIIDEDKLFQQNQVDGSIPVKLPGDELNIFIATPNQGWLVSHYVRSLIQLNTVLAKLKISSRLHLMQSSIVTHGRNLCVAEFLKSPCSHMLFIDSDVEFDHSSFVPMLKANKDIVLTPYPMKVIDFDKARRNSKISGRPIEECGYYYAMAFIDRNNIEIKEGLCEIDRGPAGFMLMKRGVFDKMIEAYPDMRIKQSQMINGQMQKNTYLWNFFDTEFNKESGTFLGEDFAFCKRWRAIGGKIYATADPYITHHGSYAYHGRFIDEGAKVK